MPSIRYDTLRHAFVRGEEAAIELTVRNDTDAAIEAARLLVDVNGVVTRHAAVAAIAPHATAPHLFRIPTGALKAGEYTLKCTLSKDGKSLGAAEFPLYVARSWNPDRMRVWLWPHTKFGIHVAKLDPEAKRQFAWYADIGVNSFQPYGELDADKFGVFDYALCKGWEMGIRLWGAMEPPAEEGYSSEVPSDLDRALGPDTQYDVARDKKRYDAFHPKVADEQNRRNRAIMQIAKNFPHVRTAFYNSELGDAMLGVETPQARQHFQGTLDTVPHHFLVPGVIPDNDEKYVTWLYNCKWGDGYAAASERAAQVARGHVSDFMPFYDPHRAMACYDRFRGSAFISTWTYTNPDPKYMLYIETLIATAKPDGQGVLQTVTLLNYPGTIFPQDKGWTVMGPDRLVETSWINLSRRPDGLGLYLSSDCDPIDTTEKGNTDAWWSGDQREPYQRNAATFEAFRKFTAEVVEPYGPMIGKLDRTPRRAAVLSSESSRIYSDSPALVGHYNNLQIYSFYTLLNMAHIPADVILDETVLRYGLDDYDVLVLPKCDTLLKSVYDRILEFQKRGGLVIADQHLRAPIPGVVRFDFDFTYRDRISANAILEGQDYTRWDDQLDVKNTGMKAVRGVTAEEDQQTMERYAADLRAGLDPILPARTVDCSSPTALLNMLQKGEAKYLFIVNDKRTYGDRVGQHKAMLDKALPQTVTVTLNEWPHDSLYAYDIIEKKALTHARRDGGYAFDVDLPAPGGKIIALLPQPVGRIEIRTPQIVRRGAAPAAFHILVLDAEGNPLPGALPLHVRITDPQGETSEFTDYHTAPSGVLPLDFIPALNDTPGTWTIEVSDLVAGLTQKAAFEMAD